MSTLTALVALTALTVLTYFLLVLGLRRAHRQPEGTHPTAVARERERDRPRTTVSGSVGAFTRTRDRAD